VISKRLTTSPMAIGEPRPNPALTLLYLPSSLDIRNPGPLPQRPSPPSDQEEISPQDAGHAPSTPNLVSEELVAPFGEIRLPERSTPLTQVISNRLTTSPMAIVAVNLNTHEFIPHEAGSPSGWIEPGIA